MSLPARTDVDPQHRFDLTRIFETPEDWDAAAETLRDRLSKLESEANQPLDSALDLRELLELTEECHRRKQRVDLYALLSANVNTDSDAASDRQRRQRDLESKFDPAVSAVLRRLRETDDDRLDALLADVGEFQRYAEQLRARASHARASEVEDAVAAHGEVRSGATRVIEAVTTEDLNPDSVQRPDGEKVELRFGNFRAELRHDDRDYRRRAYEAYWTEMDRFENTLARTYAEKLAAAHAEVQVRGYDSIRDRDFRGTYPESGVEPVLPSRVHDAMLSAVRSNLEPHHRTYERRRERLGVETLRPWDLSVPLADAPEPEIPYAEATDYVVDAFEPLGEEYVERTRTFFEERRVDVFPTQNKRTDIPAYCPSSAADGAFVLANYRKDIWSLSVVGHELGHALNAAYYGEGPTRDATCPNAVCEVPSLLNELLVIERCIEAGGALADHAKSRLVDVVNGNFYKQTMRSAFAHDAATAVEDGESLSAERLRATFADLLTEFRPAVEYDDRAGRNWLGTGRRDPYSSFQYVLGITGALVVRDRLREGSLTPTEYHDFLRNTGRESVVSQFDRLGIDVASPEPYERAAATIDEYLDDL